MSPQLRAEQGSTTGSYASVRRWLRLLLSASRCSGCSAAAGCSGRRARRRCGGSHGSGGGAARRPLLLGAAPHGRCVGSTAVRPSMPGRLPGERRRRVGGLLGAVREIEQGRAARLQARGMGLGNSCTPIDCLPVCQPPLDTHPATRPMPQGTCVSRGFRLQITRCCAPCSDRPAPLDTLAEPRPRCNSSAAAHAPRLEIRPARRDRASSSADAPTVPGPHRRELPPPLPRAASSHPRSSPAAWPAAAS